MMEVEYSYCHSGILKSLRVNATNRVIAWGICGIILVVICVFVEDWMGMGVGVAKGRRQVI